MIAIEDRLVALGTAVTFPHEDSLADDVVAAIDDHRRGRRPLLVAAAVLLVVAATVVAIPDSRRAVARWLGFDSLRIEVVDELPAPVAAPTPGGLTLDEAAVRAGVRPLVAPLLGDPVAIEAPNGQSVRIRYDEAIVETLPGRLDDGLFRKLGTSGVTVTTVDVEGGTGYWITGDPHVFLYEDAEGTIREIRVADDTLVWSRGEVVVRVEGELTLARALEIARSVRER